MPAGVQLIEGDVASTADVARAFAALPASDRDVTVFHLAAQPSAAMAVREPEVTERSNLVGARVVLSAARERGARVVFGGSARVYGDELLGQAIDEQTPYGRVGDLSHLSKVYVEQLARCLEVGFSSVRLGVVYGLSPLMKTSPAFMTVPNLFCERAATGQVLQVLQDRPLAFIHVDDAVSALLLASERLRRRPVAHWEVVNAAPEVACIGQVARIVQTLARARGLSTVIEGNAASEAGFEVRSVLETEDGFRPSRTLTDGLDPVVEFFAGAR